MQFSSKSTLILSLLSAAILTACGGGSGDINYVNGAPDAVVTDKENPVHKFLQDLTEEGQQNSPSVASLDQNNNGVIDGGDRVAFNQPGVISEITTWGHKDAPSKPIIDAHEKADKKLDDAKSELQTATSALETAKDAFAKETDPAKQQALQKVVNKATADLATANAALKKAEADKKHLNEVMPTFDKEAIIFRDINGVALLPIDKETIDIGSLDKGQKNTYLVQRDAGVSKIDKIRENGVLKDYGGSIDRKFNRVILLRSAYQNNSPTGANNAEYIDAYLRAPSEAGWNYQTFGLYSSKTINNSRDLVIGYQSVGNMTAALPPDKKFKYEGISHAYYNKDQVTSHNEIWADFRDKSMTYETKGSAILHTWENGAHVIESRPDLNVSGNAKWAGTNRFVGEMKSANGLNGQIDGRFYGPNAVEVGGVYGLSGQVENKTVHYVGGFGGKKVDEEKRIGFN